MRRAVWPPQTLRGTVRPRDSHRYRRVLRHKPQELRQVRGQDGTASGGWAASWARGTEGNVRGPEAGTGPGPEGAAAVRERLSVD